MLSDHCGADQDMRASATRVRPSESRGLRTNQEGVAASNSGRVLNDFGICA